MVPAVALTFLLLVQSGFSAPAEKNCSTALDCYTNLRKHFQDEINDLPGVDPVGGDSYAKYRRFCGVVFLPESPCSLQPSFKTCSTHPDIAKRERVYVQLRGFVCNRNETDWKRFQAIRSAQLRDPCNGAINAVQDVLRNDTAKCGSVRQLFNECASQQRLSTEVLEPGMELLGCKDVQPKLSTPPSPRTQPYPPAACKVNDVRNCLDGRERHLATGLGLGGGLVISEEESCRDQKTCLDQLLDGCSFSDTLDLPVRQATIDEVRRAACGNGKAILKGIRSAASCFDAAAFRACLAQSDIRLGNAPTKDHCDSAFRKANECVGRSAKPCFPADQVENANELIAAYLGTFGCASSARDPAATQAPAQKKGKGNGSGLVSTNAVAISVGLAAALALRH